MSVAAPPREDLGADPLWGEPTHRAMLNILEDAARETSRFEQMQAAMVNILADFAEERERLVESQRAVMNILEDLGADNARLQHAERLAREAKEERDRLAKLRERVAVEATDMGVWDYQVATGEFTWSKSHFQVLGYPPAPDGRATWEMLRRLLDDADVPPLLEAIDTARRERSLLRLEHRMRRADDGRLRWFRFFGRFLYDEATGDPVRLVGIVHDDTERHEVEEERREAEDRFGSLVRAVREYALFTLDASGHVSSWNEGAERIYGYTASEVVGRPRSLFYTVEETARAAEDLRVATQRRSYESEGWRVRKDGSRFWANTVVTARRDGGGTGFFVVTRDLTERHAAEQAIREANVRLEERVADLEAFSFIVSHDLRAPLRAIEGYARFLEEDLAEQVGPPAREMLTSMRAAAIRMDHLIRDVLTYSRVAGAPLTIAPVDLDAVVAHVVAHYPEVRDAEVHVRAPLGVVEGQESLLLQVLSNLLGNAVKFVPEGRKPRVDVWSERRDDGAVRVVVQDNGIGIPEEHLTRIFRAFERLHPSEAAWPGTGIGLFVVKKAIDRLGGRVGVASEPGRGSRFWFELHEAQRTASR